MFNCDRANNGTVRDLELDKQPGILTSDSANTSISPIAITIGLYIVV